MRVSTPRTIPDMIALLPTTTPATVLREPLHTTPHHTGPRDQKVRPERLSTSAATAATTENWSIRIIDIPLVPRLTTQTDQSKFLGSCRDAILKRRSDPAHVERSHVSQLGRVVSHQE
jgi:hypothetical protein